MCNLFINSLTLSASPNKLLLILAGPVYSKFLKDGSSNTSNTHVKNQDWLQQVQVVRPIGEAQSGNMFIEWQKPKIVYFFSIFVDYVNDVRKDLDF